MEYRPTRKRFATVDPIRLTVMHVELLAAWKANTDRKPSQADMNALATPVEWLVYGTHEAAAQRRNDNLEANLRRIAFQHAAEAWVEADSTNGLQLAIGFNSALRQYGRQVAEWTIAGLAYADAAASGHLHNRLKSLPGDSPERHFVSSMTTRLAELIGRKEIDSPAAADIVHHALTDRFLLPPWPRPVAPGQNYALPFHG